MLSRWRLHNFKSFHNRSEIELKPLTLICGINSSGKSSFLQSILLIKQTIEHAPKERVIALNGPLVQLGTFSDILNYKARNSSPDSAISIGWEIQTTSELKSMQADQRIAIDEQVRQVRVDFSFDTVGLKAQKSTLELQPDLLSVGIDAESVAPDMSVNQLHLDLSRSSGQGRAIEFNTTSLASKADLRYKIRKIDVESKEAAESVFSGSRLLGCGLNHFFPSGPIIRYDRNKQIALRFATEITRGSQRRRANTQSFILPVKVCEIVVEAVRRALTPDTRAEEIIFALFSGQSTNDVKSDLLQTRMSDLSFGTRRSIEVRLADKRREIVDAISEHLGEDKFLGRGRIETLANAEAQNERFFRFLVRYLGPLRADPRPLYPLQALTGPTDVGPKGELTAAVLYLNSERIVETIASASFASNSTLRQKSKVTLIQAVTDWLTYLGIASEIDISEKGKFGHELRVRTPASAQLQDLTNVGVGVSQVLPIITNCLLANAKSTIILEQPELHLHPRVETRLADFFIAMMLLGKQCLIETHSEHLIDRLRFRIAEDTTGNVLNNSKILFFEQKSGSTEFRDVQLSKYGAIEDWPKDFFDQSQEEAERIVLKGIERMRDERSAGRN